jgi:hypothetical protein
MVKRKLELDIRVYRGSDGMEAAAFKASTSKWGGTREIKKKLWAAIGPAIERLDGGGSSDAPRTPEVEDDLLGGESPPVAAAPAPRAPARETTPPPRKQPVPSRTEPELDDELPPGVAPARGRPVAQARDEEREALALETHADAEEGDTVHPAAYDFSVGARIGTRSFGYNDSLPGLRPYSLIPSPSLSFVGHWYPAAHFSTGPAAHIGLDVRADMLVGVSSENKAGQKFGTSSHRIGVGVRGRLPMKQLELGAVAGWGQHAFGLSDDPQGADPDVPDIKYSYLRIGADARYQFMPAFAVQLQAAYLAGLSLGEISSPAWFPHATGNGLDLELGFQLAVAPMLSFELAVSMQRYFMSLNPEADDPGVLGSTARVAGGALDKYFSSRLGLIIRP